MTDMQFLVALIEWLMLLLALSLVINGFYALTRGQEEELPDGTMRRTGQLLRGWYFFWFQERSQKKRIQYTEERLEVLLARIRPYLSGVKVHRTLLREKSKSSGGGSMESLVAEMEKKSVFERPAVQAEWVEDLTVNGDGCQHAYTHAEFLERIPLIEHDLKVKIEFQQTNDGRIQLAFYKEEPDYVFNEYVRKVMAGCITCFSSLYGSLLFWSVHLLGSRGILNDGLYGWVSPDATGVARIVVWLATIVSLCYVNTVLWKKFNQ